MELLISPSKGTGCVWLRRLSQGNTLLQYFDLDSTKITAIGEVNDEKIGKFTPSSNIPILAEDKVLEMGDLFVVLPWHFKDFFFI